MLSFWVLTPCRLVGRCQRFGDKHCLHLQAEVAMLESGGIYVGLEEGKAEGVGQSGARNGGRSFRRCENTKSHMRNVVWRQIISIWNVVHTSTITDMATVRNTEFICDIVGMCADFSRKNPLHAVNRMFPQITVRMSPFVPFRYEWMCIRRREAGNCPLLHFASMLLV
jgi:hypothetical protein